MGIALLPESAAEDFLKSGQLVQILPEWKAPHGILHAVYPSRRGLLPAVRVFIDYLVEHLSNIRMKKKFDNYRTFIFKLQDSFHTFRPRC